MKQQIIHGVRLHDRETEDDPHLATLMYTSQGENGPWHDLATGHPDSIWELFEMTYLKDELDRLRRVCEKHDIDWYTTDDDE